MQTGVSDQGEIMLSGIFLQASACFACFGSSPPGLLPFLREAGEAAGVHRRCGRPSAQILTSEGNQRLLRSCAAHSRSAAPCVHVGPKLLFSTFALAKRGQLFPLSAFHLALAFAVISRF